MYLGNPPVVNASRLVYDAYATQGQTVITPPGGYTVGQVEVIINGSQLSADDFTATDGSTIVLAQGMGLNDTIKIVAYGTFAVANTYSQAQVDAKVAEVNSNIALIGPQFKNRIINGGMTISQRGTSFTSAGAYSLDRWYQNVPTPSSFSVSQSSTAPAGFTKSLAVTVTTGGTIGGAANYLVQFIEGNNVADLSFGTSSASTITISFWVRSSVTGTFGGALRNSAVSPATSFRSYPFTYSISASNTWEYKTVTITGDGTAGAGQWNTDTSASFSLFFDLGSGAVTGTAGAWAGANAVGATGTQTSLMTTNGATFYITGVQLEKGSTATSFDYRPYGTELALCQRYYEAGEATLYMANMVGPYLFVPYKVDKRAAPTVIRTDNGAISGDTSSSTVTAAGARGFYFVKSGTTYAVGGGWTASAEL